MRRFVSVVLLTAAGCWSAFAQHRIVSLSAPVTETLYALGARDRIIGVTDVAVFPDQVVADRKAHKIVELGSFMKPDLALLRSLHPDLVFTDTAFHRDLAKQLAAEGFRVEHFEPTSLPQILQQVETIGKLAGVPKQGSALAQRMRTELEAIRAQTGRLPKVRLYLEINHEGPWTTGSASPLNDLIEAAGGVNIFAERKEGVFVTSHDEIVRRNPEVILSPIWVNAHLGGLDGIIPLGQIFARPGYDRTAAVLNSRVHYYDSALFKHEGPRQILAIRKLAHLLHPDQFPDPPGTIAWELGRLYP